MDPQKRFRLIAPRPANMPAPNHDVHTSSKVKKPRGPRKQPTEPRRPMFSSYIQDAVDSQFRENQTLKDSVTLGELKDDLFADRLSRSKVICSTLGSQLQTKEDFVRHNVDCDQKNWCRSAIEDSFIFCCKQLKKPRDLKEISVGLCGLLELIGYFGNWTYWREAKLEEKALQEAKAPALRLAAVKRKIINVNDYNVSQNVIPQYKPETVTTKISLLKLPTPVEKRNRTSASESPSTSIGNHTQASKELGFDTRKVIRVNNAAAVLQKLVKDKVSGDSSENLNAKIALPRQFPCSFCKNTGFQTEQYLNNHMWTVHGVAPKKPSQPIRKVIVQSRFNASQHEGDQSSSNQHPLDASQANKNKKDSPDCSGRESPVEVKKEDEESTVSEKPTTTPVAPALSLVTVNIPNDSLLEINKEVRNLPVIKEEDIKDEPPEEKVKINDETKDAVVEIKQEVSDD